MPIPVNGLAVMAKAPIPGEVKTRLMPALSAEEAAELYRALLLDQLEHLQGLSGVEVYLAYAPEGAGALSEAVALSGTRCFAQEGGDLGARMNGVLKELWRRGHRNAALIGSDLPALPLEFVHKAFELLAMHRVVLGPSRDGGYYLIGMNQPTPEIFRAMTWSHGEVLAQTLKTLGHLGIAGALLPVWFDLDTPDDLDFLQLWSRSVSGGAMKRTLGYLRKIGRRHRSTRRA